MSNEVTLVKEAETEIVNIDSLKSMSVSDIDNYGAHIQQAMTDASSSILQRADMIDLGSAKQDIDELYDISKKAKRINLPIVGKPLNRIKSWASNHTKVQGRLDVITVEIDKQKERIDQHVVYMQEQINNLQGVLVDLRMCENELTVYAHELDDEKSDDQIRVQAVAQRLRNINGTRVIAEQAQAEALMILAEQREVRAQLEEVIKNAIPAIQIQAVNSIGIKVNKETQEIISRVRDVTGNVIVQNATEVKNMAEQLSKNRTKSIVDDEKLMKAQNIMLDAIRIIDEASQVEADTNLRTVAKLQETARENEKHIRALQEKVGVNDTFIGSYNE